MDQQCDELQRKLDMGGRTNDELEDQLVAMGKPCVVC